jgi:hypothetical protein
MYMIYVKFVIQYISLSSQYLYVVARARSSGSVEQHRSLPSAFWNGLEAEETETG